MEMIEQRLAEEKQNAQDREEKMEADFRQIMTEQSNAWTQRMADLTATVETVRNTALTNRNAATNDEYRQATNVNYFRQVNTILVYAPGQIIDNDTPTWKIRQWDQILRNYQPKLKMDSDIATWFGIFENSCSLNEIPIETRFRQLMANIMEAKLQEKLLKKTGFFDGIGQTVAKYKKLRKWLCSEETMIQSIQKERIALLKWTKLANKTLIENLEDFQTKINNYIYQIRFAITHDVEPQTFDIISEQELFKVFMKQIPEAAIEKTANKYTPIKNITVLGLICKQLNKDVKLTTKSTSVFCMEELEQRDPEQLTDEEVFAMRQYGVYRRYNNRQYGSSYKRKSFGNYRSTNYRDNNRNKTYGNNKKSTGRCFFCYRKGHFKSECKTLKTIIEVRKLVKQGKSDEEITRVINQIYRNRSANARPRQQKVYAMEEQEPAKSQMEQPIIEPAKSQIEQPQIEPSQEQQTDDEDEIAVLDDILDFESVYEYGPYPRTN